MGFWEVGRDPPKDSPFLLFFATPLLYEGDCSMPHIRCMYNSSQLAVPLLVYYVRCLYIKHEC